MKAILTSHIISFGIKIKPIVIALFIIVVLSTTALIVVRQQCLQEGYEISKLVNQLEEKGIEYKTLSKEYSNILRREVLIKDALTRGFVFPSGDKVFYVER